MAREAGLAIDVLDEKRIAELKMGALLAVARGSAEPPRLIVLTYTPEKPVPGAPVLGLVGKAITFDTGGISIKPANDMEKMKFDMAGGAAMLGAMRALARLKPRVKVIAVIPSTENMPGGRAQKPGDVQIAMSGKSIEVINTDAEGRLILADGIAYAKQLGATHLVDAATLTGAIVVALGAVNTGVFGTDEAFTRTRAGQRQGGGRKDVAHAARRRISRADQEHHCRHSKRGRPRGGRDRRRRGSCANSPATRPGCISILPAPRGSMTPSPGPAKAAPASACAPWWNWP